MKSYRLFLSFALLAQLTACNIASSGGVPKINVARADNICAMLVLAGQTNKGYKYSFQDGSYTVKFPGKPEEATQSVQSKLGPVKVSTVTYIASGRKRIYTVTRVQSKVDAGDRVTDAFAGVKHGMLSGGSATLSQETSINYKGVPGREFYLTVKQAKVKVRIFAVRVGTNLTLYSAMVNDTTGKVDDAEVNSFLDSLTFKPR